jgi:hypothetical protein
MIAEFLDDLDNLAIELLLYGSWLVAGLVLIDAGVQHLLSPVSATVAGWLASHLSLQVTQFGLSLGGVLNLAVRGIGLIVLANGVGYLLLAGQRLLKLGEDLLR